ncbi:MAG: DUF3343 domain-containing protein [Candidatus Stygibacter australis]|nr:DUF3343 domain-containing protein [Candidatus Stygibacter australis]MDP8322320.1 DUF3343 domain-containing protein [Candidatus Stygibacter australis]
MNLQIVITFHSTHSAMAAEDIFKELKLDFELIPTPREISAECGFALLVRGLDTAKIKLICNKNQIKYDNIYLIKFTDGGKEYEKSN